MASVVERDGELAGVGLSDDAERVYRALLAEPGASREAAERLSGAAGERFDAARAELVAAGLVDVDGGRVLPVDPRIGLGRLIRARQDSLDSALSAVDGLARDYLDGQARAGASPLAEPIDGRDRLETTLRALISSAEREVAVLDTPPYADANPVEGSEETSLHRGVVTRVVYAAEVLELPRLYDSIRRMTAAGERARVLPTVPMKLLIVDGSRALIPVNPGGGVASGAVLVHPSPLADAMAALFESLWANALPLFEGRDDIGAPLDAAETELLGMLASGIKDEAIARRLGVSVRTVSRRVNRLLDRLGAANRFQAGMQATRRGWLPD